MTLKVLGDNRPSIVPWRVGQIIIKNGDTEVAVASGYMSENVQNGQIEWIAIKSDNLSSRAGKNPEIGYLNRVVGKTITELVCRGFVSKWYSGEALSDDAKRLYEDYLPRDARLVVVPPNPIKEGRYLVMAKPKAK